MSRSRPKLKQYPASPEEPCPICGGISRPCFYSGSSVLCGIRQEAPEGWERVSTAASGQGVFIKAQKLEELEPKPEPAEEQPEAVDKDFLRQLDQLSRSRLDLSLFLHPDLATLFTETAEAMPTAPEFLLTTFLAVAASRIGTAARVVVKAKAKYIQPCVFQAAIIAGSGSKKTPAQRLIIDPLDALEAEEYRLWDQAMQDYQLEKQEWEQSKRKGKDAGPSPTPPSPRKRFICTDATIEARVRIHSENPRGLLVYRDEAAAFLSARNKYRQGAGDDSEQELSEFNGGSISKDRTADSIYLAKSAISRTGSFQTKTLQRLMGDHEDVTGEWARWLLCMAPCPPGYIDLTGPGADQETGIYEYLMRFYKNLCWLEPQDYLLSFEAKQRFEAFQHQLVDLAREENHPGLATAYPKFESYLSRIALLLHIVNSVAAGNLNPEPTISGDTMERAILLTRYYMGQLRLIYTLNAPEPENELSSVLLKIQAFAQKKKRPISTREVISGVRQCRESTAEQIQQDFLTLAEAGCGVVSGEGSSLRYEAADGADTVLTGVSTAGIKTGTSSQPFADTADAFGASGKEQPDLGSENGNVKNPSARQQNLSAPYAAKDTAADNGVSRPSARQQPSVSSEEDKKTSTRLPNPSTADQKRDAAVDNGVYPPSTRLPDKDPPSEDPRTWEDF